MSRWIDVTVPVVPGMPIYEGDPDLSIERVQQMSAGAICNVTRMELGVHTGTHIDAPVHFIEGAHGVEATPADALIGAAYVIDATGVHHNIDAATLNGLALPADAERVLFKTPNSALWARPSFCEGFVGLMPDAAELLARRKMRLVGIDYLSIAPAGDPAPTHIALLSAGVVILEGLDLRNVEPGAYDMICLPMLIPGSDGAPARTMLRAR